MNNEKLYTKEEIIAKLTNLYSEIQHSASLAMNERYEQGLRSAGELVKKEIDKLDKE